MFQKVKLHMFIKRYLPIFLSVFVFVFCVPTYVLAAEDGEIGVSYIWDGIISVETLSPNYPLYVTDSIGNDTDYGIFKGSTNLIIHIDNADGVYTDTYLNGYVRKRLIMNCTNQDPSFSSILQAYGEPVIMGDVFVSLAPVEVLGTGYSTYDLYIGFNNYYLSNDSLSIPFLLNMEQLCMGQTDQFRGFNIGYINVVEDWHGDIQMYDRLEDVPSMDGYFAEQNTEIINQSTINNDLLQQQIQQDHQDTLQQTDTLTNGFDTSAGNAAANRLDDTTGNLNDAENSLFGTVSGANEDYTDITDFFTNLKVLESFSFIKSIMESIFVAMGDFAMPITIAFMFMIVTRIIGYQQFASGGGD